MSKSNPWAFESTEEAPGAIIGGGSSPAPVSDMDAFEGEEEAPRAPLIPNEIKGKDRLLALQKIPVKRPADRTEPKDLPAWARSAITMIEVNGLTAKEAAEAFGKSERTITEYLMSPIAKQWRKAIREFTQDPIEMAKALLKSSALGVTVDVFHALEAAKLARDYKEQGIIARDLMDRIPGLSKKAQQGEGELRPTLVINMGAGASLEIPMSSSSFETKKEAQAIEGADYEIIEEG